MLTKDRIMSLLKRLGEELKEQGLHGEILLTGGAAMCLVHSARDMTKDVDALYEPKTIINQLARKIAKEEGALDNWLNDSVKGFVTDNITREDFQDLPGLKITTVSADYLLAMKLISARYGETDYEDIMFLLNKLNINTEEVLRAVVTKYYPAEQILLKTGYLIEQLISDLAAK